MILQNLKADCWSSKMIFLCDTMSKFPTTIHHIMLRKSSFVVSWNQHVHQKSVILI